MSDQVVWAALSVTHPETGEDLIVKRDDFLPDWTDSFTAFALRTTGATRHVQDGPALPEPEPDNVPAFSTEQITRPSTSDTVDVWRAYAVNQGLPAEEANKATKADLISRYRS
jgi:hypothetical protein